MVSVALIGVGRWGRKLLPVLTQKTNVVAVSHGGSQETDDWLKQHYPHLPVRSVDEIARDSSIQAVIIATPPQTHKKIAELFLTNGKDVWVEKPLSVSGDEASSLAKTAEDNKKIIFVGYVFMYHPAWSAVFDFFSKRGERVSEIQLHWSKYGSFANNIVDDLACHHLSLGLMFFPEIDRASIVSKEKEVISFTCSQKGSVILRSDINRLSQDPAMHMARIAGERGSVFIIENNDLYEEVHGQKKQILITGSALENEIDAFVRSIETREKALSDARFAMRVWNLLSQLKQN